jgi:hypothetical protein
LGQGRAGSNAGDRNPVAAGCQQKPRYRTKTEENSGKAEISSAERKSSNHRKAAVRLEGEQLKKAIVVEEINRVGA